VLAVLQMLLKENQAASSPRKCGADAVIARDGRVSGSGDGGTGRSLIHTAVAWMAGDGGQILFWPVVTFLGAAYLITASYVWYQIFSLFFPAVLG
jgi:xanthine/CO dehydrogenase XdhC/CoxF family maturation factor